MRSLMFLSGAVIIWGASALAQEQSDNEKAVQRVREKFHLSDEQAGKLKEVLDSAKVKLDEAKKAAEDAVKGVVGDENFKQAMELINRRDDRRGDRGGNRQLFQQGGDPSQFFQRFYNQMFERMQNDLGMNEEQTEKVKKIWEKFTTDAQKMFEDMRNSPEGFNWQDAMQQMKQKGEDAINEMKTHLDDEQKGKLDDLVSRMRQFGGFGGGGRGPGGGPGGDRGPRPPSAEERVKDAAKAMGLGDSDEDKALKDKIAQVAKLQDELEKVGREDRPKLIGAIEKETNEDEIAAKVEEFINKQLKLEGKLKTARKELLEMVANQPKWAMELIKRGIL